MGWGSAAALRALNFPDLPQARNPQLLARGVLGRPRIRQPLCGPVAQIFGPLK